MLYDYNPINTFISHCIQNFYWKHPNISFQPSNKSYLNSRSISHDRKILYSQKSPRITKRKKLEDAKRDGKNHINSTIHPRPASSEASIPSGGLHYDLTRSSQYLLTALITFNNRKQHEKYSFINTILLPHKKPQFSCKFTEYAYESKTTNLT